MLWGGRFKEKFNDDALKFTSSLKVDIKLIYEDILVSKAHTEMLEKVKLISSSEKEDIIKGLDIIIILYQEGKWRLEDEEFEDIHSAIEYKLYELIGDKAGKLHTGRSRNDQVATDMKLWVKKTISEITDQIKQLQLIFLEVAEQHKDTIIPGYTHLQRAQPISFGFHLMAYVEMLERDKKRIKFAYDEADVCPLGSGALAGSTLPLDREFTAERLGFRDITGNSLDAVSDRDFVLDFLSSCSTGMIHLSRLAEELILWSTSEWNFVRLGDKYTTGSSLMPQKKNPDIAELIRGKTGSVIGNYISFAAIMKGLPLSYNRDLQEDKKSLFDSADIYNNALYFTGKMIESMTVNKHRFDEELKRGFILATDAADYLVLKGIPFREAHRIVGEVVKYCEEKGKRFNEILLDELRTISNIFDTDIIQTLNSGNVLGKKKTAGSPNPKKVKMEIEKWKEKLII